MKKLVIGDLTARIPIIQGGMGVGISLHKLAAAVAREGGIGVISAAQPGFREPDFYTNTFDANMRALAREIKLAKEESDGGIIGVNIMVAVTHYEDFVKCCIENGADLIVSGAGLPMDLPKFAAGSDIKLAPIVSSAKACKVIFSRWVKKYDRLPDLLVIEGPKAGGHLGFKAEEVMSIDNFDDEILKIIETKREFEEKYNKTIPVVFGGGVYSKEDVKHCIEDLGLDGVQMATRFVATEECDADIAFKEAYIKAKLEDVKIVKSPVGMPGRALNNHFIKDIVPEGCKVSRCFKCLVHCDPKTIPYCISKALFNGANGDIDNALVFCGENVYKIDKISTVKDIIDEVLER
ncbi:MAG: nitronate monooxygenase family protein [Clostridia bacterium]|nr:nitronate monooxygenase family protein [Clostridia bacterium]